MSAKTSVNGLATLSVFKETPAATIGADEPICGMARGNGSISVKCVAGGVTVVKSVKLTPDKPTYLGIEHYASQGADLLKDYTFEDGTGIYLMFISETTAAGVPSELSVEASGKLLEAALNDEGVAWGKLAGKFGVYTGAYGSEPSKYASGSVMQDDHIPNNGTAVTISTEMRGHLGCEITD